MRSGRRYLRYVATNITLLMVVCYVTIARYQRYSFRDSVLIALAFTNPNDPSVALVTFNIRQSWINVWRDSVLERHQTFLS